ncbi:hypothetical protein BaRGS_00029859 [Batillaria attramentaria]|uniref:Uncharacterized protein n=1 Tax=Batillaria attramentaria TaxID=370345 RepID=A0ABD0JVB8_9CAEN
MTRVWADLNTTGTTGKVPCLQKPFRERGGNFVFKLTPIGNGHNYSVGNHSLHDQTFWFYWSTFFQFGAATVLFYCSWRQMRASKKTNPNRSTSLF